MMLRESTKLEGNTVNLHIITSGAEVDGGVPTEKELLAFADAALGDDSELIKSARDAVMASIGETAMIDAAGVISNFQRMVRIADGTGIPLDPPLAMITAEIRDDMGLNNYSSAQYTPEVKGFKRFIGGLMSKMIPFIFRRMRS